MDKIIAAYIGTPTALGLFAILAYLFFKQQVTKADNLVQKIVEREGYDNSEGITKILAQFANDAEKLQALIHLLNFDETRARELLNKISDGVNPNAANLQNLAERKFKALLSAGFFLMLAIAGLAYVYMIRPDPLASCGDFHRFSIAQKNYTVFCTDYERGEDGYYYQRGDYKKGYPKYGWGPDTMVGVQRCNEDNLNKTAVGVYWSKTNSMSEARLKYVHKPLAIPEPEEDLYLPYETSGIYEVICRLQPKWGTK